MTDTAAPHGVGSGSLTEATRGVAAAYVDALNAHDPDAVVARVAEDFRSRYAGITGREFSGRDEYRRRLPKFFAEFPGVHYETEAIIADGEHAAVPYQMSATWMDKAGAGHPFSIRGVFVLRMRDGVIAERTDYWDSGEFARQTA